MLFTVIAGVEKHPKSINESKATNSKRKKWKRK
jgi:hypothetical protein